MRIIANCKFKDNTAQITSRNFIKMLDGEYELEFRDVGKSRSLSQNAMLWGIIGEIATVTSGGLLDETIIYTNILEMAGVKYSDIELIEEAYEDFKSIVKYTRILGKTKDGKLIIRTFAGSSTFNTKEMGKLIDIAIRYAEEKGIVTDYWKDLLGGK